MTKNYDERLKALEGMRGNLDARDACRFMGILARYSAGAGADVDLAAMTEEERTFYEANAGRCIEQIQELNKRRR